MRSRDANLVLNCYQKGSWMWFFHPETHEKTLVKDVIATLNLNGDYISDALAPQVGGIGIAPGANISDQYAVFEATHGAAPKYAGQDKINPGSIILSAENDVKAFRLARGC